MNIIRGTTPTIDINITSEMDLSNVVQVWVYIAQQKKPIVDKVIEDVTIDTENSKISVRLEQEDTLKLKAGADTLFQIRMLMEDDTALATTASKVTVIEVYKGGVIE